MAYSESENVLSGAVARIDDVHAPVRAVRQECHATRYYTFTYAVL